MRKRKTEFGSIRYYSENPLKKDGTKVATQKNEVARKKPKM